jgi:gliding motility-associated lipoprotein GldD
MILLSTNQYTNKKRMIPRRFFLAFAFCIVVFAGCGPDDEDTIAPKPRAYFRLNFPEKKYVRYDSIMPFTFEMPVYSKVEIRQSPDKNTRWLNLNFPSFNGTLNLTYKEVNGDLDDNLNETYSYVTKHQVKASGIEEKLIEIDSNKVYGLLYNIGGNAASSVQFFVTDSVHNYLRGALYFNAVPNTDSIKPVVDFIRQDIYHMIETFRWKETGSLKK